MENNEENKNQTQSSSRWLLTPMLFAFSVAAVLWIISSFDIEKIKNIGSVTAYVLALMFVILLFEAKFARKKLLDLTTALNQYGSKDACENEFLNACVQKFRSDKEAFAEVNPDILPDISDYINEQIIGDNVHRQVTDQIANAMTGLGILGTFIGLTIGLQNFNSLEVIGSTPELLNGIKIAFYTSIFGVIASIIYNHFYHADIEKSNLALERFYDYFYREESPSAQMDFYGKMLGYAKKQDENLGKLAGAIGDEMVKQFDRAIKTTINNYIIEAVNSQSESLKKIVDAFMESLNKALDDQFDNLSHSISDMCSWQNESTEKLKAIMGSLNAITENMSQLCIDTEQAEKSRKEINEGTNGLIDRAKRYADAFRDYSEVVNGWTEALKTDVNERTEYNRQLKQLLEEQIENKNALTEHIAKMITELESNTTQLEGNITQLENIIATHNQENINLMEAAQSVVKEIKRESSKSRNIDRQYIKSASELLKQMQETWENHSRALNDLVKTTGFEDILKHGLSFIADSNKKVVEEKVLPAIYSLNDNKNAKEEIGNDTQRES